jgi:hypothetical protein
MEIPKSTKVSAAPFHQLTIPGPNAAGIIAGGIVITFDPGPGSCPGF